MLNAVRLWILFSTLLVASGWVLSALHQLNYAGYGVVFASAVVAILYLNKIAKPRRKNIFEIHKFSHRFKKPAPFLYLALVILSLIAGMLYLPANADSNAYRIPRILEWLGAGQWHWLSTLDIRMNIAGCGFEWLATPLILFTHSFRFIFLINWISYLLLPTLIFSVFTKMGVRPRMAWWWMWLLPSGWCYAMQAASDVNDSFAAVYALASVGFALRARKNKNIADLWFSMLAIALLTGTKQTIIPLALVCIVAIAPTLSLLRKRFISSTVIMAVCLLVSFAPLAIFNFQHTGHWSGVPSNAGPTAMFWERSEPTSPFWGIVGNVFCLSAQNLEPPFFPWSDKWNGLMQHFLQTSFGSHFVSFENFGYLRRAMTEESAGIGLGIVLVTIISIFVARKFASPHSAADKDLFLRLLRWCPFVALLIFMAKVGTFQNARQLSPYYIFFFPVLLAVAGHERLVRRWWWQALVIFYMLLTALLLVVARNRPLFPAQTVIAALNAKFPQSKFVSKISESFSFWDSMRSVVANPLKKKIPQGEHIIGYATVVGFSEPGIWLPFGSRKMERILPEETADDLRNKNIRYVFIGSEYFESSTEKTLEEWLKQFNGELVDQITYDYSPGADEQKLFLVHLR